MEDGVSIEQINGLDQCREESATDNLFIQLERTASDVNNIQVVGARVNNSCKCIRVFALDLLTQGGEDTVVRNTCLTRIQIDSVNWSRCNFDNSVVDLRCRSGCLREYEVTTNHLIGIARCLNHTVDGDHQLILVNDNLLTLNCDGELLVDTVESVRNVIQFLNDRSQNFLRRGKTLLTEEHLSIIEVGVDRLCCTERGDLVDVTVVVDIHLLGEFGADLTTRHVLTTSQLQLTEECETSSVVILQDLSFPVRDRSLRLNDVREVLIEEGVLNLLDNLRRLTNVIDKSTRSLGQRSDIQHTTSNAQVINQTRCLRDGACDFFTCQPVAIIVNDLKNLRTNLPTSVS